MDGPKSPEGEDRVVDTEPLSERRRKPYPDETGKIPRAGEDPLDKPVTNEFWEDMVHIPPIPDPKENDKGNGEIVRKPKEELQ